MEADVDMLFVLVSAVVAYSYRHFGTFSLLFVFYMDAVSRTAER